MKFALVSYVLPPSWSGQAVMIYRLLQSFGADDYCLITLEEKVADFPGVYSGQLPGKHHYLPREFMLTRGYRFGLARSLPTVNIFIKLLVSIPVRGVRIARVIRREGCEAVIGCSGGDDFVYLPASFVASRLARVPFYAYLFDDYSNQWTSGLVRSIARRIEPQMLKRAAGVVAHSEFLRDELRSRHGLEATVIHNPCDLSEYTAAASDEVGPRIGEVRLVYTGSISEGQLDALLNLVRAIELSKRKNLKLHLYSAQPAAYWSNRGLRGPVVYHPDMNAFDMPAVQMGADVLFLPLAFESPYPEHIKSASPAKTGEYLASGRPILVHAPRDSFLVWYFRTYGCGLVVDEPDPAKLAEALNQLLNDEELRRELREKALERARVDFSIPVARSRFAGLLKLDLPANAERKQESSV